MTDTKPLTVGELVAKLQAHLTIEPEAANDHVLVIDNDGKAPTSGK